MKEFEYLTSHKTSERQTNEGFAVISRLGPGETHAYARTLSVKLVLEGEEIFRLDRKTIRVPAGAMLVVETDQPLVGQVRTQATGMCLSLPLGKSPRVDKMLSCETDHGFMVRAQDSELGRFLERSALNAAQTFHSGTGTPVFSENFKRKLISELPDIVESYATGLRHMGGKSLKTSRARMARAHLARAWLADNRRRSVTLEDVSRAAAVSHYELAKTFFTAFSETPMAFHRRLRMDAAWTDLVGGHSPAMTADRTGFYSLSAFNRAFYSAYGIKPSALRH